MTYQEQSTQLTLDASVAVFILMGTRNDIEFVPLKPRAANESMLADIKARWPGRGLRSVGVIGLVGTSPALALKEPLTAEQTSALTVAFLEYLHVLFADGFAAHIEAAALHTDSVAWCERLYALEDPRPYPHVN